VEHDGVTFRGQARAQVLSVNAVVDGAVKEVRDHLDVGVDRQPLVGVGLEALRHGGDAVRLVDAAPDGLRVRLVAADQRDVRAM